MSLEHLAGQELGTRRVTYTAQDAALYALAVGAEAAQLDLVYERDLVPLPTYVAALGMWATVEAAVVGGYLEADVLHAAQKIELFERLPAAATIEMTASIPEVSDKGSAAIVHVVVSSTAFRSTYAMFVRGGGGWGGDRGNSIDPFDKRGLRGGCFVRVDPRAAALYRLTGDRHSLHIDPEVARRSGLRGPILHGLCTFGTAVRAASEFCGASALEVSRAQARFIAPVYPGDVVGLKTAKDDAVVRFSAEVAAAPVLTGSVTLGEVGP